MYPVNGYFIFNSGPIINARANFQAATINVPADHPGLYFIYAPYTAIIPNANYLNQRFNGQLYILIYIGKAGMGQNGFNHGGQMLYGRINNVGTGNRSRSQIWTDFMNENGLPHLLFRWAVTSRQLNPPMYDNCFFLEQAFCKIWQAIPELKPALNNN